MMEVCVYRFIEIAKQGILDMVKIQEARLEEEKKQTQILQEIANRLKEEK